MEEREIYEISKRSGFIQEPGVVSAGPYQVIQHTTLKYEYDNEVVSVKDEESDIHSEPGNLIRVYASGEEYENWLSNHDDSESTAKFKFTCGADIDLSWLPNTDEDYWSWSSNKDDEIMQETLLYLGDEEEPLTVYNISFAGNVVDITFDGKAISGGDTHFIFESNPNRELLGDTCEFVIYK